MVKTLEFHALQAIGVRHFPDLMPNWAQEFTLKVCATFGVDIPEVKWAYKNRSYSTGRAYSSEEKRINRLSYDISVTAGSNEMDARLVLLHELAHFTNPMGEHHGFNFWNRAFDLYESYGISLMYAHNRERRYRAMAEEVGWQRIYAKYGDRR